MKKKYTPTPHDAVFRQLMANRDTAKDFMELHLPAELRKRCDLSTLKLESGSFVEDSLRSYFSDVLYSLKTTTGDDGYVMVLVEHQSSPDQNIAFRLMRYAIAAMQRHLDAGHNKLPLVIPVLFYAGKRSPHPYSTNWLRAFDDPVLAEQVYTRAFPLVDVTVIPDDAIMEHRRMAVLTLLQKHIHQRDLMELRDSLTTLLLAGYTDETQLKILINYMLQVGETRDPPALLHSLASGVPQHEDTLMTIAEYLRNEGKAEGKVEGKLEEKQQVARNMLTKGFDEAIVKEVTGLSDDELKKIIH